MRLLMLLSKENSEDPLKDIKTSSTLISHDPNESKTFVTEAIRIQNNLTYMFNRSYIVGAVHK